VFKIFRVSIENFEKISGQLSDFSLYSLSLPPSSLLCSVPASERRAEQAIMPPATSRYAVAAAIAPAMSTSPADLPSRLVAATARLLLAAPLPSFDGAPQRRRGDK